MPGGWEFVVIGGIVTGITAWRNRKTRPSPLDGIYGHYCVCFTKGKNPSEFTYIPWISRIYETEEEWLFEEEQLMSMSLNPEKNTYWREQGINGIAVIDLVDGNDCLWVSLREK